MNTMMVMRSGDRNRDGVLGADRLRQQDTASHTVRIMQTVSCRQHTAYYPEFNFLFIQLFHTGKFTSNAHNSRHQDSDIQFIWVSMERAIIMQQSGEEIDLIGPSCEK